MQSTLAIVVMITLAFIFPIGAAYYAYKKNRQGWAVATIAATFVGAGWLVGVIAIIVPAKPVKGKMGTQCPRCAGQQGSTLTITASRETGQPVRSSFLTTAALVGGFAVCVLAGWMAVSLTRNPLPANSNAGSACGTVGFMISIGGTMIGWGAKTLRQRKAGTVRMAKHTCDACGHQWQQELPSQRDVPRWIEKLSHQDWHTRQAAAEALGQIGDPQVVPSLITVLKDDDARIRIAVATALGQIGAKTGDAAHCAAAVDPMLAVLREDQADVRAAVAKALGQVGAERAVEQLIAAFQDKDKSVRWGAAQGLMACYESGRLTAEDKQHILSMRSRMAAAAPHMDRTDRSPGIGHRDTTRKGSHHDVTCFGEIHFDRVNREHTDTGGQHTDYAGQVTIPKSQPSQPSSVEKPAGTSQRSSRSTHSRLKWILIVGVVVVVAMIGIPLGIGLMAGMSFGTPTNTPTPGPTPMGGGGRIVLVSDRDGNPEIYVMDPDGSSTIRLTDDPANDVDPAWSPDRQRIAFVSDRDGNPEIYVMNADGSDVMRLTDNPASESAPAWSPDGQRIAFVTDRDGNFEIYIMHSDGSGTENLTSSSAFDTAPAWSPDGQRIAFSSWRDEGLKIYVIDPDGSNVQRLTEGQTLDCSPIWSPSGQHIAFVSGRGNAQDDKPFVSAYLLENGKMFATTGGVFDVRSVEESVYVMSAGGSGVTQLTEGWAPAWSPDGQHIVFVSERADTIGIYVTNPDGSNVTRLTDSQVLGYAPAWGAFPVQEAAIPVAGVPSPTPKPAERATNTPAPVPTSPPTPSATATPTSTPSPTSTSTLPATATPTSTPSPVPTTTPVATSAAGGAVIFVDTFDSNAAGWPTGERDNDLGTLQLQITGGKYRWEVGSWESLHRTVADGHTVTDFVLSVDAGLADGTSRSNYGVIFRRLDGANYYFFTLSDTQEFLLLRKYEGKWTRLTDWIDAPAIRPGEMNRITVIATGSEFAFYINDQFVRKAADDKLPSGRTGLAIEVYDADKQVVFEFDNFELRHPSGQAASSSKKVIVTGGLIRSMALSPDGSILAVAGKDSGVQLWNTATGQAEFTLTGHTDRANDLAFTPDGRTLASAGNDDTATLWDAMTGQMLYSLEGHTLWVNSVAFSPDGKILASGSADRTVKLWDVATGRELRILGEHTDWVYSVAFSPKGDLLAAGSCHELEKQDSAKCVTGEIVLWNIETGQTQQPIHGHEGWVNSLAFSPDGRILASGSDDDTIHLWDTNTGQKIATLDGHKSWVNSLAFSPDGRILASGSGDGTVCLWDPVTGRVLDSLSDHPSWIISIAFTADGRILASANEAGKVILWPVTQGQ